MPRVNEEDSIIVEEYYSNPDRFCKNVQKLAGIVLHQHYPYIRDKDLKEDLIQEGIMKAIELCNSGDFDVSKSSLRNYLYTGIRNQMQNYLYKMNKLVLVDEIHYTSEEIINIPDTSDDNLWIYIKENLVYDICDKFWVKGNYHNLLIKELKNFGLVGDFIDLEPPADYDSRILEACFIEYVWRARDE